MVVPGLILHLELLLRQVICQHVAGDVRGQRALPPPCRFRRCPGLSPGPAALSQSHPLAGRAGPAAAPAATPRRPTAGALESAPRVAPEPAPHACSPAQRGTLAEPSQAGETIQTREAP